MYFRQTTSSHLRHKIVNGTALVLLGVSVLGTPTASWAGPTIKFGDQGFLTLTYGLQLWTQYQGFTSPTDSGSTTDTFLRRNRITFSGQYNDFVGFYAQIEAGNDGKRGNVDRSVYYRDAYITLDYSDAIRFIGGRFKNTFSRENLEACLEPLTLDRAEVISYTPFGGTRDTGYAMWGNLDNAKFQYRVMIANGRDDENAPKHEPRMTVRVHWSPLEPEYDYGYRGTYLGTRKVFTLGAAYDYQANVAYADYPLRQDMQNYSAYTVDAFWETPTSSGTYTLSGAYFKYDVGNAINQNPDPTLPVTTQLRASYVKGAYLLPDKIGIGRLQLFLRHETSDYNLDSGLYDQTWNGGGFNYYINGQQLKVTFEYDQIKFDKQDVINPALQDYKQATVGLQLIF
jgi:hypothetical protein